MRRLIGLVGLVMPCVAAAPATAQQSARLRYAPPVGQVSHYRMTVKTWARVPRLASRDTVELIMADTVYSTQRILSRRHGLTVMTVSLDSSRIATKLPVALSPESSRGVILREVIDSLGRRDSTAVTIPPHANRMVAQLLKKAGMGGAGLSVPPRRVRVGESWTDSMSTSTVVPEGGKSQDYYVHTRSTYRLERLEHRGADRVAVFSAKIVSTGTAGSRKESSTGTGLYRFDLNASRLISATLESRLSGGTVVVREATELLR